VTTQRLVAMRHVSVIDPERNTVSSLRTRLSAYRVPRRQA